MMLNHRLEELIDPRKPALSIASRKFPVCNERTKIKTLLETLVKNNQKRAIVADSEGGFKGLINDLDLLGYLGDFGSKTISKALNSQVKNIMKDNVHLLNKNQSVKDALITFKKTGQDVIPIINKDGKVLALLSKRNLVEVLFKNPVRNELMIKHIMVKPMIVKEHFPINEVAKMMSSGNFRRFPLARDDGVIRGIVTVHDIFSFLGVNKSLRKLSNEKRPIKQIANKKVFAVKPETKVTKAVKIMLENKIGALPVVEGKTIKGIVTFTDVIDSIK